MEITVFKSDVFYCENDRLESLYIVVVSFISILKSKTGISQRDMAKC